MIWEFIFSEFCRIWFRISGIKFVWLLYNSKGPNTFLVYVVSRTMCIFIWKAYGSPCLNIFAAAISLLEFLAALLHSVSFFYPSQQYLVSFFFSVITLFQTLNDTTPLRVLSLANKYEFDLFCFSYQYINVHGFIV